MREIQKPVKRIDDLWDLENYISEFKGYVDYLEDVKCEAENMIDYIDELKQVLYENNIDYNDKTFDIG